MWDGLRRRIDDIPTPVAVTVDVSQHMFGTFLRVHQADLAGPPPMESSGEPRRIRVEMRFRSLIAAEALLAFGTDVEVLAPLDLRQNLARKSADTAALYATAGIPAAASGNGADAPSGTTGHRPRC